MEQISVIQEKLAGAFKNVKGSVAGPNPVANTPNEAGRVAGFWLGVWHGAIAPITFIISLSSEKVGVFEVHNSGKWYVLGFLLGVTALWGGGGHAASRRK